MVIVVALVLCCRRSRTPASMPAKSGETILVVVPPAPTGTMVMRAPPVTNSPAAFCAKCGAPQMQNAPFCANCGQEKVRM